MSKMNGILKLMRIIVLLPFRLVWFFIEAGMAALGVHEFGDPVFPIEDEEEQLKI